MKKYASNLNPKTKKLLFSIIVLVLIAVIVLAMYILPVLYTRTFGMNVKPSQDYSFAEVEYYLQNDSQWSSDQIGKSNYSMGGYGCLITSVASSLTYNKIPVDPQELNHLLTNADGYENADLLWFKLNEIFPTIDYKYSRTCSGSKFENYLKEDILPIVKVKYKGTGIFHWILIVGAKDGEFYTLDPLEPKREAVPLSNHGKVYAYRVLVSSEN